MKFTKAQRNNFLLFAFIAVMIIPQTRRPIQLFLQKGLAMLSPSVIKESKRKVLTDYEWTLVNEHEEVYDFNEAKGKVVLINFWATWCPPCVAEMPSMDELYKDYKDKVVFLFVSNEDHEVIAKFKSKHDFSFNVHSAASTYPKAFDVSSIPRTFILNKSGAIAVDKSGAADWNSNTIRKLLDELLAE